jgi:hypothetical protein
MSGNNDNLANEDIVESHGSHICCNIESFQRHLTLLLGIVELCGFASQKHASIACDNLDNEILATEDAKLAPKMNKGVIRKCDLSLVSSGMVIGGVDVLDRIGNVPELRSCCFHHYAFVSHRTTRAISCAVLWCVLLSRWMCVSIVFQTTESKACDDRSSAAKLPPD